MDWQLVDSYFTVKSTDTFCSVRYIPTNISNYFIFSHRDRLGATRREAETYLQTYYEGLARDVSPAGT